MARSRRKTSTARRARRMKVDWVYRPHYRDDAGNIIDAGGTYEPNAGVSIAAGQTNGIGVVLYDSHNYMKQVVAIGGNAPTSAGHEARAEGRMARIIRVQGWMVVQPTVWAVGSSYRLGMRFGRFEQDPNSGSFLLSTSYTLWLSSANINFAPSVFANTRLWTREHRHAESFNDNSAQRNFRFNFKVGMRLKPDECYGIWLETISGSATLNAYFALRTLINDEG